MKKLIAMLVCLLMLPAAFACNSSETAESKEESEESKEAIFEIEGNETTLNYNTENPVVAILIKGYGKVVCELYPDKAPNTVNNFISLVKKGFYDNNTMHRCIAGFVLQGGDPTGTGRGGPGYTIKGEFSANGVANDLKHTEGVLSMARTSVSNDTAGSQFFIMLGTAQHLDGQYAAFGKVIEGMDIVQKIAATEKVKDSNGTLAKNLTIEKMVVDTKGVEYPEPDKIS
jgi:peptidyl-prolyl cis-trans isomerase B (cyclophilin B)